MASDYGAVSARLKAGACAAIALVTILALVMLAQAAFAQQDGGAQLLLPGQQRGGSTLTLPTIQRQNRPPSNLGVMTPQRGAQSLTLPSRQLCNQAGYAQVQVTVTGQSGSYISGLNKPDFRLYVDSAQRPIEFFRRDSNAPASVGIVVDTSGSMEPKLPQARNAISLLIRNLNPNDDVFLYAFNVRPFLLQPFTTDHALVIGRLALLQAYGQTALYDAIMDGLLMLQRGRYDKRVLLVVTDGEDNSSVSSLGDVVAQARRMGVLIYSIGIGNSNAGGTTFTFGPFAFGAMGEDTVDARALRELSTQTGAKTFIIPTVGDGAGLRAATEQIGLELRQQYTLGFVARNPSRVGYRSIRVEVPGSPGSRARVRPGVTISRSTTQTACADLNSAAYSDPR